MLATCKVVVGLLLFPLAWALEGWIAWRLGGGTVLGAFLVFLAREKSATALSAASLSIPKRSYDEWLAQQFSGKE